MIENILPEGVVKKLAEFKIVETDKLVWTHDFMVSVRDYLHHPPSMWEKTKVANRAKSEVQPVLLVHAHDLAKEKTKFKTNLERLIVSYCYLEHHLTRLGMKADTYDVPNLVWGIFVVDRLNPEAV